MAMALWLFGFLGVAAQQAAATNKSSDKPGVRSLAHQLRQRDSFVCLPLACALENLL